MGHIRKTPSGQRHPTAASIGMAARIGRPKSPAGFACRGYLILRPVRRNRAAVRRAKYMGIRGKAPETHIFFMEGSLRGGPPKSPSYSPSKVRRPQRPRMRQHVADVAHAREVHDEPLEAEAVAGVAAASVAPQVEVPPVVALLQPQLVHARGEDVEPLLALAAADELADGGHQAVGGGDGACSPSSRRM